MTTVRTPDGTVTANGTGYWLDRRHNVCAVVVLGLAADDTEILPDSYPKLVLDCEPHLVLAHVIQAQGWYTSDVFCSPDGAHCEAMKRKAIASARAAAELKRLQSEGYLSQVTRDADVSSGGPVG